MEGRIITGVSKKNFEFLKFVKEKIEKESRCTVSLNDALAFIFIMFLTYSREISARSNQRLRHKEENIGG